MHSAQDVLRLFDPNGCRIERFNDFDPLIRDGFPREWSDRFFEATKIDRDVLPPIHSEGRSHESVGLRPAVSTGSSLRSCG